MEEIRIHFLMMPGIGTDGSSPRMISQRLRLIIRE
jgi:hypothetical protein